MAGTWVGARFGVTLTAFALLAIAPVAAAPVGVSEQSPTVQSNDVSLSSIGQGLLPVLGGFLVVSEADLGLTAVTLLASEEPTDGQEPSGIVVLGNVAAQGDRVVAVDAAGPEAVDGTLIPDAQTPVLRLFRIPTDGTTEFTELGIAVLPEEIRAGVRRFGTSLAIGGNAIAVVSETTGRSDRVDIFTVSPDGTAEWSQELTPQTLDTSVSISTSGATIALSGVNRLAASGEVIINRIGPIGWVPTQRFLRIGGGQIWMQNDRIFVQRNSFFARPSGSWTMIGSTPGQPFEIQAELSVEGDSVSGGPGVVIIGDSENDLAYLLEETATGFRFSQALRPPTSGPSGAQSRFGASVAVLSDGTVLVGAPGGAVDPAGEIFRFSLTEGPVGCTTVGTPEDDVLQLFGQLEPETVCGLGGNDEILGAHPDDRLLGGPGDDVITGSSRGGSLDGGVGTDTCTQAGPATAAISIANCES